MLEVEQVRRLRLAAQGLVPGLGLDPAGVVDRAVALQGQDLPAVLRAIAQRSGAQRSGGQLSGGQGPGRGVDEVRAAFDRGELVRAWPMRGTLFATTPDRLAGLLALTAERTEKAMARRRGQLGLDDATIERSGAVAAERIADGPVGRAEMLALWQAAGIETSSGRGYHLIVLHALRGLWHWGPFAGDEQCLVATSAREPSTDLDRLLADVVAGYVRARGPAAVDDVVWWLKLPKGQVRRALALCTGIAEVEVAGREATHLVEEAQLDALADLPEADGSVLLLPAFDEYFLGYQRRDLVASEAMQRAVVPGGNGMFRPLVVVDGRVVGTWRLGRTGGELTQLVEDLGAVQRRAVDEALAAAVR